MKSEMQAKRAEVYLNLNYFHRAKEEAESVLKLDPVNKKCNNIKARALIGLSKYSDAHEFVQKVEKEIEFCEELLETTKRLDDQQKSGNYNFAQLSKINRNFRFDEIADNFTLESIQIKSDVGDGKGRGVVNISDHKIPAGTLLHASRAIVLEQGKTDAQICPQLVKQFKKCIDLEPERVKDYYKQSSGEKIGILEKLSESLCTTHNTNFRKFEEGYTEGSNFGMGIWIFPSFINHDCIDQNVKYDIYGDFLFLRCIKDIEPGAELFFSYLGPKLLSMPKCLTRRDKLNFKCMCRLCKWEEKEPKSVRQELDKKLVQSEVKGDYIEMARLIKNRQETSPAPELNLQLIPWMVKLLNWKLNHTKVKEVLNNLEEIIALMKCANFVSEDLAWVVENIIRIYAKLANDLENFWPIFIRERGVGYKNYVHQLFETYKIFHGFIDIADPDENIKKFLEKINQS